MKKLSKVFSLATVFGLFTEYPYLCTTYWLGSKVFREVIEMIKNKLETVRK